MIYKKADWRKVGLNLRVLRVKAGYSREELSEKTGISKRIIVDMEIRAERATLLNLYKVTNALNTDIKKLFE